MASGEFKVAVWMLPVETMYTRKSSQPPEIFCGKYMLAVVDGDVVTVAAAQAELS